MARKKQGNPQWSHANVYADYKVRQFNTESSRQIWEFMDKHGIPLTDEQRDELTGITDSMEDVSDIEQANAADIANWLRNEDAIEAVKDIEEIKDHFKDVILEEQRADGWLCIQVKESYRRDKLVDFMETEIYPHYNDQQQFMQLV